MSDVFILWRLEFDSMENREPIRREIVGYATTAQAAADAGLAAFNAAKKYEGRKGGWGGERAMFPMFEVQMVSALREGGEGAKRPPGLEPDSPLPPPSTIQGTKCGTCVGTKRVLSPMDGDGPPVTDPCPSCGGTGTQDERP